MTCLSWWGGSAGGERWAAMNNWKWTDSFMHDVRPHEAISVHRDMWWQVSWLKKELTVYRNDDWHQAWRHKHQFHPEIFKADDELWSHLTQSSVITFSLSERFVSSRRWNHPSSAGALNSAPSVCEIICISCQTLNIITVHIKVWTRFILSRVFAPMLPTIFNVKLVDKYRTHRRTLALLAHLVFADRADCQQKAGAAFGHVYILCKGSFRRGAADWQRHERPAGI